MGEPIDLLHIYGRRTARRWRHDGDGPWDVQYVRVGELPDGRWWVEHAGGVKRPTLAYPDQTTALVAAAQAMADRHAGWVEMPAEDPPLLRDPPGRLET